jgi:hypothetical protein
MQTRSLEGEASEEMAAPLADDQLDVAAGTPTALVTHRHERRV